MTQPPKDTRKSFHHNKNMLVVSYLLANRQIFYGYLSSAFASAYPHAMRRMKVLGGAVMESIRDDYLQAEFRHLAE